jgi:Fic family protein
MIYNWQKPDWPQFTFSLENVEELLFTYMLEVGTINGYLAGLDEIDQLDALIRTMVAEALKSSEIEGEYLDREDVKSSVRNNLGLNNPKETVKDKRSKGMSSLLADVRSTYKAPLNEAKLLEWHRFLMLGVTDPSVGRWRTHTEPMQVISGALGKQRVHFEAPPSAQVPKEMHRFIAWFNATAPDQPNGIKKPIIRAALAHLYFESIHPFEDGNGRIGRCISEKALSQDMDRPVMISLSRTIEADKKRYYSSLEKAQKSNEITPWIQFFVDVVVAAQEEAKEEIAFTLQKTRFFDQYRSVLNARQLRVVQRMLAEGPKGFEGGMNARKYMGITKTSKATATRDLKDMVRKNVCVVIGGGRSTRYTLNGL